MKPHVGHVAPRRAADAEQAEQCTLTADAQRVVAGDHLQAHRENGAV